MSLLFKKYINIFTQTQRDMLFLSLKRIYTNKKNDILKQNNRLTI